MFAFLSRLLLFLPMTTAVILQACKRGDVEATRHLMDFLDPSINYNEAIIEASREGHSEIVQILLADPRVDPSAKNNGAIRFASNGGHAKVVELLLADPRVRPSAHNNDAICLASFEGHATVIKLLLADPRVDPSADDNYAIRSASFCGHADVVGILLDDSRVDPSADDNYAICYASIKGHTKVVKLLLAHPKVSPNSETVQKTFKNSNLKVEFFQAATVSVGLAELMPIANLVDSLSLETIDILISRAKDIQLNQEFLHSLRLAKLPIPDRFKMIYGRHLQALFSVVSSSDVMKLVEFTIFFAKMGFYPELLMLITRFL